MTPFCRPAPDADRSSSAPDDGDYGPSGNPTPAMLARSSTAVTRRI
jgi:hypothetical protein